MRKIASLIFIAVFFCATFAIAEEVPSGIEKLFLQDRYENVVIEADKLIEARSYGRDQIYYLKGLSQLKLSRFSDARRSFEEMRTRYPRSKTAFFALVGIGDTYYLEGNTNEAARIYNEAISTYPNDRNISVVREKLSDCQRRGGSTAARTTQYNFSAGTSSSYGKNYLSVQVGSFKNSENAERLSRQLAARGYDTHVEKASDAKGDFYRVKVGRCSSRFEAEQLEARLKAGGHVTKICDYDESR